MQYTIAQLAKAAHVSVRTLHHYDAIGLLKPSYTKENGYRYYQEAEMLRLQQILFFKELEFSLTEIKAMLDAPNFDQLKALEQQRELLILKSKRINNLIHTIDTTIFKLKGGETMSTDDIYSGFGDEELKGYMDEAKNRWGNSKAYQQSMQKVKNWTKADYVRIKKEGEQFTKELAAAMDLPIESQEVQALIEKHHQGIEYFYECPMEMYRNLGQMYVDDPRFTKYYDKHRQGLAQWLHQAINYYCDQHSK